MFHMFYTSDTCGWPYDRHTAFRIVKKVLIFDYAEKIVRKSVLAFNPVASSVAAGQCEARPEGGQAGEIH